MLRAYHHSVLLARTVARETSCWTGVSEAFPASHEDWCCTFRAVTKEGEVSDCHHRTCVGMPGDARAMPLAAAVSRVPRAVEQKR